jgi:hypothetical protein
MRAAGGSLFGTSLVDRHVAIVDPLLVHPLPAQPLLSSQCFLLDGRIRRRRIKRSFILGDCGQRETGQRETECDD